MLHSTFQHPWHKLTFFRGDISLRTVYLMRNVGCWWNWHHYTTAYHHHNFTQVIDTSLVFEGYTRIYSPWDMAKLGLHFVHKLPELLTFDQSERKITLNDQSHELCSDPLLLWVFICKSSIAFIEPGDFGCDHNWLMFPHQILILLIAEWIKANTTIIAWERGSGH